MKQRVLITLFAVVAMMILGALLTHPRASADSETFSEDGFDSIAYPEVQFLCPSINQVAVFENRIHLRCSTADGSIRYFAYATDPEHAETANQILAIGNTAFVLGRSIYLFYNSNSALNPPGCLVSDCRGLFGVSMV